MNAPGKRLGNPFYIMVSIEYNKNDIIETGNGELLRIIKTYKLNWWKKILKWLGFNLRNPDMYKVIYIGQKLK